MDLDLLFTLLSIPGVSGFEQRISAKVAELAGGEADEFGVVTSGRSKVAFVAHLDEVGLIATSVEDDGKVKFRKAGSIDDAVLKGARVIAYGDSFELTGVIGVEAPHFGKSGHVEKGAEELYADFGLTKEELESLGFGPLTPIAFEKRPAVAGRFVTSPSLDDRAGTWALLAASREVDAKFVWTTQEEVGLVGAKWISRKLDVKYAVVVDTMACCNPAVNGPVKPGKGPVIRLFDNYGGYATRLARAVLDLARRRGIPVQIGGGGGGTDAAAFVQAGVLAVAIGIPNKYAHSPAEMVHLDDLKNAVELIKALAQELPTLL
ncbi:M42 family metallopeptidase [Thermoproteus tenax]|uniref:Cellulase M related protein (Aminopeptidase family M42) n=1 Tax=Thermoproteus tenax (strain ATCC 35583 / DSM 2078 / JCM 9277 / NBRC 100435 / Kra 1) TaxID=768679 RepID=G4RJE3_THETK|nr:M20/M25/M40 family metallo-hydrolase [Thermoproteus tenax]CCC81688.1 cellulase M related protein (aminopeptidase family M42) [Thermoproteus tenax Kra 1]